MKNELTNNLQKLETNLNKLNKWKSNLLDKCTDQRIPEINREMRDETANLTLALRGHLEHREIRRIHTRKNS
ncbi:MAG: hypothetical protein CM1200mP38_8510 [Dehalococcoidia bacterium]|nr:MAG: hypothetical protein CM1200mP38_8510 [Dehalococcoidia bacterium]